MDIHKDYFSAIDLPDKTVLTRRRRTNPSDPWQSIGARSPPRDHAEPRYRSRRLGQDRLGADSIAAVATAETGRVTLLGAEMIGQFGAQGPFDPEVLGN
jgi:hypothetical protein